MTMFTLHRPLLRQPFYINGFGLTFTDAKTLVYLRHEFVLVSVFHVNRRVPVWVMVGGFIFCSSPLKIKLLALRFGEVAGRMFLACKTAMMRMSRRRSGKQCKDCQRKYKFHALPCLSARRRAFMRMISATSLTSPGSNPPA